MHFALIKNEFLTFFHKTLDRHVDIISYLSSFVSLEYITFSRNFKNKFEHISRMYVT